MAEKNADLSKQALALAEFAGDALIGAEKLGIKKNVVANFPLGKALSIVILMMDAVWLGGDVMAGRVILGGAAIALRVPIFATGRLS